MIEELKGYCSDCRISTSRNPQQCDSADKCVVAEYAKILEQSLNGKIKTPEDIVPSVELCRKLPKEYFKESIFVWYYDDEEYKPKSKDDYKHFKLILREYLEGKLQMLAGGIDKRIPAYIPAPTLQEILSELPEGVQVRMRSSKSGERHYQVSHYSYTQWTTRPAAAALRMWLRIQKEKE